MKEIDSLIKSILVRTKADYFVGFFGYSGGTFRHRFATIKPYKGARKSEPWQDFFKPIAREYFEEGWGFYGVRDIEADDAVVIAYHQYKADYNIVMVEEDKDGLQKGAFTRFNPRTSRLEEINHLEGRAHFWGQFLVGEQSPIFI